jgi:hypothetical protein
MTDREIMQQALETLLWANAEIDAWMFDGRGYGPEERPEIIKAITALREALKQPEQRKPLTDEEMMRIYVELKSVAGFYSVEKFARAIEAAHGIGENT